MKVYLLQLGREPPIFYSEGPLERAKIEHKGVRGWLERRFAQIHSALWHSDRGLAPLLRKASAWLSRQTFTDERWLLCLRAASEIELYHPTTLPSDEARTLWQGFLAHRQWRHLPWLIIDILICPFTLVLVPLPGPNVVGIWFVYRAGCHALVLIGVRACRSPRMPTSYLPSRTLDTLPGETEGDTATRAQADCHLPGLRGYLERTTGRPFDPHDDTARADAGDLAAQNAGLTSAPRDP